MISNSGAILLAPVDLPLLKYHTQRLSLGPYQYQYQGRPSYQERWSRPCFMGLHDSCFHYSLILRKFVHECRSPALSMKQSASWLLRSGYPWAVRRTVVDVNKQTAPRTSQGGNRRNHSRQIPSHSRRNAQQTVSFVCEVELSLQWISSKVSANS
jgi:hypothetical protein